MSKTPATYIVATSRRGTVYIGATSRLIHRVWQHRESMGGVFTSRYGVTRLVWYELHPTMRSAIAREKAIKKWNRAWKLELVERSNPDWRDLWNEIVGSAD